MNTNTAERIDAAELRAIIERAKARGAIIEAQPIKRGRKLGTKDKVKRKAKQKREGENQ